MHRPIPSFNLLTVLFIWICDGLCRTGPFAGTRAATATSRTQTPSIDCFRSIRRDTAQGPIKASLLGTHRSLTFGPCSMRKTISGACRMAGPVVGRANRRRATVNMLDTPKTQPDRSRASWQDMVPEMRSSKCGWFSAGPLGRRKQSTTRSLDT